MSAAPASLAFLGAVLCASCRAPEPGVVPVDPTLRIGRHVVEPAAFRDYLARVERHPTSRSGRVECSYTPLAASRDTAYLWVLCMELVRDGDSLAVGTASSLPMALRIDTTGPAPRVVAAWRPEDGRGYGRSIRARFPPAAARLALELSVEDHNARVRALEAKLRAGAALRHAPPIGSLRGETTRYGDTMRRSRVPERWPDTVGAVWPAARVPVRCYRSSHSVLFGPPTKSGQQGRGPGWIRLEGLAAADTGRGELVDADRKGLSALWRRGGGDSVSVVAADDFLRVELLLAVSGGAVGGWALARSDAALEPDPAGRLRELRREWLLGASRAPCDRMPVPWHLLPWR